MQAVAGKPLLLRIPRAANLRLEVCNSAFDMDELELGSGWIVFFSICMVLVITQILHIPHQKRVLLYKYDMYKKRQKIANQIKKTFICICMVLVHIQTLHFPHQKKILLYKYDMYKKRQKIANQIKKTFINNDYRTFNIVYSTAVSVKIAVFLILVV